MCTVSYVNRNETIIITSNRDENANRPLADKPKIYQLNGRKVIYPKDPKGGGTWFAVNDLHTAIVLLNGAKNKHVPKPAYKMSRGLVVLELITKANSLNEWQMIDLSDIEPFTLIMYYQHQLFQLQWDGNQKDLAVLDSRLHYIWSSSTLYPENIREERKQWFADFMADKGVVESNDLLDFHTNTKPEDKTNGLIINRNQDTTTKNITQLVLQNNRSTFIHQDLVRNAHFSKTLITV